MDYDSDYRYRRSHYNREGTTCGFNAKNALWSIIAIIVTVSRFVFNKSIN